MDGAASPKKISIDRWVWSGLCFALAALALLSPIWPGARIAHVLGEYLIWLAIIEIYDGFRRADSSSKAFAQASGGFSLLMGAILINAAAFQPSALYLFVTLVFAADGLRHFWVVAKAWRNNKRRWLDLAAGIGNFLLVAALFLLERQGIVLVLSIAVALRMVGIGINVLIARTGVLQQVDVDVAAKIGLAGDPYVAAITEKIKVEEEQSAIHDRRWITTFVILLFVVHLGRMGLDRSSLGILSPFVATLGDMVIAVIVTYVFFAPLRMVFLTLMRRRSQRLWKWIAKVDEKDRSLFGLRSIASWWLSRRIRAEIRFIKAGYSMPTALRLGLKIGLPWSAGLAAIMPVLGMSWYFDTENWASGIWDKWAASRADKWRMAISQSAGEGYGANAFQLRPAGVNSQEDFSFVVVGDPGEGDASQLILKDQILAVSNKPEVKFVVISSDVVYPTGALRDYEKKFWMPFKGVMKPVYAIPGNHDWYDALDGFAATFFEPAAARKAMLARVEADLKLSSTTPALVDEMIATSAKWRKEYEVPTGFQKAPFFQVSTDRFVLITLETGVERQIDSLQRQWLVNVLEASRGKFVMAVLGHPFYAIGEYQGSMNPQFESLHALLRSYNVSIAMAGDTHDLEYYRENFTANKGVGTMHHFVNGGGGAYLSIGAAMAEPGHMPTKEYAFYPSNAPLVKKIGENTAWYKRPAWWWTTRLHGWPFSAEWLSAMFDYNVSPYFQSFMEIRVESSRGRVVLIPYSNHGRIPWRDITSTTGARPAGATPDDWAEWVIDW